MYLWDEETYLQATAPSNVAEDEAERIRRVQVREKWVRECLHLGPFAWCVIGFVLLLIVLCLAYSVPALRAWLQGVW